MTALPVPDGRRAHYAEFYGERLLPGGAPMLVVHGNCQAEAVRVVIAGSTDELATVRMPPVHELTGDDLPHLRRLMARVDVLASQPVRPGYRDLPIGTQDLANMASRAQVVRWPVVRHTGLHPYGALVRHPWRGDPPGVPYHDLRTVLAHARGVAPEGRPVGHGDPAGFRAVAAASLGALRSRERDGGLVAVSDLVEAAGAGSMLTINHPTNAVLVPLAARIMAAAGIDAPAADPGRTLLPSITAPLESAVLEAQGFASEAAPRRWLVDGDPVEDDHVAATQIGWYADRPEIVTAALRRYAHAIEVLGL